MKKIISNILLILSFLLSFSCSTSTSKHKSNYLDKPHVKRDITLPKGLIRWNFNSGYIVDKDSENSIKISLFNWTTEFSYSSVIGTTLFYTSDFILRKTFSDRLAFDSTFKIQKKM